MQQTTLTRRGILAGTALAALAGANVTATRALAGAVNPDAELLSAFRAYSTAFRQIDDIGNEKDPRQEAASDVMYDAWDRIEEIMPQTAAGLAAYLKVAFRNIAESLEADEAVIYGKPLDEDELRCSGERMIWRLIQHLQGGASLNVAA